MNHPDRFTFEAAVASGIARLGGIDLTARAVLLDVECVDGTLSIPFFGRPHRLSTQGVRDESGRPATPAVASLLLEYVLRCPAAVPETDQWITFREIEGAGPLMGFFACNTDKLIQSCFAGDLAGLAAACKELSGQAAGDGSGYDLCMEMRALPRVPIRITFNDCDSEFPAQCSLRFPRSAGTFLSMRSLGVAGTWLAGNLAAAGKMGARVFS